MGVGSVGGVVRSIKFTVDVDIKQMGLTDALKTRVIVFILFVGTTAVNLVWILHEP